MGHRTSHAHRRWLEADGRWIQWKAPDDEPAGVQFDAFAAQKSHRLLPTWTMWGGNDVHQPTWALHFSANTPAAVLQDLAFELAEGQRHRQVPAPHTPRPAQVTPSSLYSRSRPGKRHFLCPLTPAQLTKGGSRRGLNVIRRG
ncbi:DUF317 domain-containing protein [Streptomyces mirabilis]